MKLKTRLFFLGVFLFVLSGCTDKKSGIDNSIRFGISTEPVTLDPRFSTDAVSERIVRLLFSSLITFDDDFYPRPALANWEKINSQLYRFTLKKSGRVFHNGKVLTSVDVKASYDSILDPKLASPHRASLTMIERIEVPDPDTVDFYLNNADPLFPGRLVLGIMPADLIWQQHSFHQLPVGSGPLKLIRWTQSGELVLQRNSDQQEIKFLTVKDPTVRILKLKRGELDLFQGDVPQEMLGWLKKQKGIVVEKNKGTIFSYLGFNLQDEVTGKHPVRLAIALALNRTAIIEHIFDNTARVANAMFISEHWAGVPELEGYSHNIEKAKGIMRNLGYDQNNPLEISYKTSNNPFRIRLATVLQSQLKKVGIELTIESFDWGTFYGDIKSGRFQMYSLSWVGLKLPDIFRYAFHSDSIPPDGANRGRFIDTEVDALLEQAESRYEPEQQAELYRQLQTMLLDKLPYVPLWYEDNIVVRTRDIVGYKLTRDGDYTGLLKAGRLNK